MGSHLQLANVGKDGVLYVRPLRVIFWDAELHIKTSIREVRGCLSTSKFKVKVGKHFWLKERLSLYTQGRGPPNLFEPHMHQGPAAE